MTARRYGQYCGVVSALELVGERWALLIVRDLLVGPRRYTDLKTGLPRIPTNILSSRLKELQEGGVVRRVPLAHCGLVYELTEYGRELEDVVLALGRWGFKAMTGPQDGDVVTADSLTIALRTAFRPDATAHVPPVRYRIHVGEISLTAVVSADGLRVSDDGAPGASGRSGRSAHEDVDLEFAAGPGIRRLIAGEVTGAAAIADGLVQVLRGDATLLDRFAATFHLDPAVAA